MISMVKANYSLMNIIMQEILKKMDLMDMEESNYMRLGFMKGNLKIKKLQDMACLNIAMEIFMKVI